MKIITSKKIKLNVISFSEESIQSHNTEQLSGMFIVSFGITALCTNDLFPCNTDKEGKGEGERLAWKKQISVKTKARKSCIIYSGIHMHSRRKNKHFYFGNIIHKCCIIFCKSNEISFICKIK